MPRASPSAKRQPGVASQRDNSLETCPGSYGKRTNRIQQKPPNGLLASGSDAIVRASSPAGSPVSSASPLSATAPGCAPSSPPLLAAAAAAAAAANGCSREADNMASPSLASSFQSQQRHRNSDAALLPAAVSRRSQANQLAVENGSPAYSTDSVTVAPTAATPAAGASTSLAVSFDDSYRRIDVNAAKNANVHRDTGPLDLAMTILRSCPLYDTIAILIILMQLSPVVLSIVYMLFTVLTFVPPVTTSSGLSLTEMFEGGLGTPAFTTIICMDVGVLLVWLFLWGPLQLVILDFAQIVIALTLGGGYNVNGSGQGSANNIFVCLGIVIFSRFSHITSLEKLSHFGPLFAADRPPVFAVQDISLQQSTRFFSRRVGGASWVRNIFAIHILMQGIVRFIREWYLRREKRDSLASNAVDPEAGKSMYAVETPVDAAFPAAVDSESNFNATSVAAGAETVNHATGSGAVCSSGNTSAAIGPACGSLDTENSLANSIGGNTSLTTGHISSKKKKKQSALVRVRQPLWAALASTKIVMIKEYELSQAASESAGAEATDADHLGNAPFYAQPCQIWVCYVGHDEVCFSTSVFPDEDRDLKHAGPLSPPSSSFIDTSKPFYVRINNAIWQPTRILPVADDGNEEVARDLSAGPEGESRPARGNGTRWTGDIYGLTPLSSYECEFISTRTGEVLFSTSVRTAAALSSSTTVRAAKPAPPSQLRPHESPATTIKASIATQETKLNEEKARIKTLRKDNNRRVNALKKEIDRLTASVQSAGGNDDKFKQKITQNTVQQKQAEQAIEDIEAELKDVSAVPDEILCQYRNKKSEWDREKAQFEGVMASFKSFKSSVDSELRSLEDEHVTIQAKRNKVASRIAKADSEHAQIMDANTRGLDEAERRRQERVSIENEIMRSHKSYMERLAAVQTANEEKVHTIEALHETMRSFYSSFDSERPYENRYAPSPVPAVHAPGAAPSQAPAPAPGAWPAPQVPAAGSLYAPNTLWLPGLNMPASGPSPLASQVAAPTPFTHMHSLHESSVPPLLRMRGRSSSMLSDVSGFTQSSTADDDNMAPVGGPSDSVFAPAGDVPSTQASQAGTIRGPPAFSLVNDRSSSGFGSASSEHSGSGSAGSAHEPSSPV